MGGGIRAWNGLVAEGIPEAGIAYFNPATRPGEMIALAWRLEEGSRKFYESLAQMLEDEEAKGLFQNLTRSEEDHKTILLKLFEEISGKTSNYEFPDRFIRGEERGDVMEGGMLVNQALSWSKDKLIKEILELCLALETNSYDLYLKMEQKTERDRAKQVFRTLSEEEKNHLNRLIPMFEKKM